MPILSEAIEIRPYQTGDEEGIVKLLKLSFPHWAKNKNALQTWKWQYVDNPFKGSVAVAAKGEKIIGVNQGSVVNLKLGSKVILALYGGDSAIHPDYWNLGIYSKTAELKIQMRIERNIQFQYSSSTHPAIIKDWIKRKRAQFPYTIDSMVRIRDVKRHLAMRPLKNSAILRFGYSILKLFNVIRIMLTTKEKHVDDFIIEELKRFDDSIDVFWEKIKDKHDFIMERKQEYLNWKYCDSPPTEYKVKKAVRNGEVLGYIVIEVRKDDEYTEGYIIDVLAVSDRRDVADALFTDACEYFDDLGVNTVYYRVVEGHPYQSISSKHGFINATLNKLSTYCHVMDMEKEFEALKYSGPDRVQFGFSETL